MFPFETLYVRKRRTPVCWDEIDERKLFGQEFVQITAVKRNKLKKS